MSIPQTRRFNHTVLAPQMNNRIFALRQASWMAAGTDDYWSMGFSQYERELDYVAMLGTGIASIEDILGVTP